MIKNVKRENNMLRRGDDEGFGATAIRRIVTVPFTGEDEPSFLDDGLECCGGGGRWGGWMSSCGVARAMEQRRWTPDSEQCLLASRPGTTPYSGWTSPCPGAGHLGNTGAFIP